MTFKTPDYIPVIKQAVLPSTRKRANIGYESKTSQNGPLLAEIVRLRQQAAELLGYGCHSDWVLEVSTFFLTPDLDWALMREIQ